MRVGCEAALTLAQAGETGRPGLRSLRRRKFKSCLLNDGGGGEQRQRERGGRVRVRERVWCVLVGCR